MCQCCCGGEHHHHGCRGGRFFTREERLKDLEDYADEVKKELAAVEDQIKELKQ
jgi:hypothetical protein